MQPENAFEENRRTFLRALTAASAGGLGALSGCLGNGDSTDSTTSDASNPTATSDATDLDELDIVITDAADLLDPHQTGSIPLMMVMSHGYEGLLGRNAAGDIQPELATDWERIEDGQFRFELREGVVFHDGTEFTAEDVRYNVRRIIDPDFDIVSDRQATLDGITDVEIVDDYTVDIISDGLNTNVIPAFASYLGLLIINSEWIEGTDTQTVSSEINGTGPFRLIEYEEAETAVFEPFEDYWGDVPPFETVSFTYSGESSTRVNRLLAGESHLAESIPPADVPRVDEEDNLSVETIPSSRVIHGVMDITQEPWDNIDFRRAMNYAVDVEGYIDNILSGFGEVSTQPTLPEMFGYNPDIEPFGYDPDLAAELVEESGHAGIELELTVPVGRYLLGEEFGTAIAGMIDDLPNVSCEPQLLDFATFATQWIDTQPEEMDFFLVGYGHPSYDGAQSIGNMILDDRLGRYGGEYGGDALDDIEPVYREALQTADDNDREALLQEANRLAVDDVCWVFLHQQQSVYGVNDALEWEPRHDELMTARNAGIR